MEISAAQWVMWLGKDFPFYHTPAVILLLVRTVTGAFRHLLPLKNIAHAILCLVPREGWTLQDYNDGLEIGRLDNNVVLVY